MWKFIAGVVGGLAVAAGALPVAGFVGGCGRHGHGRDPAEVAAFVRDRVDGMLDDLDATPEQRTAIHDVEERLLAAGMKMRDGRGERHEALLAEWRAETPDAAKLHALVDARADELRAFGHQAVDAGVEVHGVLTPAQREKLARKVERWHR